MGLNQRIEAAGGAEDELLEALRAVVAELSEGKLAASQIDADAHLFDYGYVNSLSAVMFLAHVAERHGVEIEDVELIEEVTTLRAVARRIQAAG
jgi:D-alanine--poly(phosphoribitol) ligase subunit 2